MNIHGINQTCHDSYDMIEYVIISTDEERNVLYFPPSYYNEFNKRYDCMLSIVYDNNRIYVADYERDQWIINGYNQKQTDFLNGLYNHKNHPINFWEQRFIIFQLNCQDVGSNFNLSKTFDLLSGISTLEIWRIWSCYHADFTTYRKNFKAVYVVFDAEGG